jgi:pyruvate/2-oxoglutarate/acetoin dehydrogenase E1 component
MGMAEALRDAIRIAMRTDPTVFLLGEDIGVPGGFGGGFTVTLGLAEEFGRERVIDTPISEGAIVGAAVGAAMAGSRPVAEMQYGDFVFCAMDQVVNQAATARCACRWCSGYRSGLPSAAHSTGSRAKLGSCIRQA